MALWGHTGTPHVVPLLRSHSRAPWLCPGLCAGTTAPLHNGTRRARARPLEAPNLGQARHSDLSAQHAQHEA